MQTPTVQEPDKRTSDAETTLEDKAIMNHDRRPELLLIATTQATPSPACHEWLRLVRLQRAFGQVCAGVEDANQPLTDDSLMSMIVQISQWLTTYGVSDASSRADAERERQERLVLEGRFAYACGDIRASDEENVMVMSEELGEVAQELEEQRQRTLDIEHLIEELVQVLAVAVGWREARKKRAAAAA